jgi:hypothetical protein
MYAQIRSRLWMMPRAWFATPEEQTLNWGVCGLRGIPQPAPFSLHFKSARVQSLSEYYVVFGCHEVVTVDPPSRSRQHLTPAAVSPAGKSIRWAGPTVTGRLFLSRPVLFTEPSFPDRWRNQPLPIRRPVPDAHRCTDLAGDGDLIDGDALVIRLAEFQVFAQRMIGAGLPDSDFVDLSADFDECGHGPSIPLGLKDGKHVDVRTVANGLGCGCVCPTCERPLVAAQGEQRKYFRHHRRSDCESGHETGVHGLAKELLAESLSLFIPAAIAQHGDLIPCIIRQEREWSFRSATTEKTLVDGDKRRIRPDLILKGEFRGEPLELLVEIQVRHKQERWRIEDIRERGLAAIEIDLSKEPPIATRDYYRQQILERAQRRWLVNNRIDKALVAIREYWERKYGRIAERIEAAYAEAPFSSPDRWVQDVVAAGLEELIGIEISGGACFTTSARIWQAAILHRYVLTSPEEIFDPGKALSWLQRERFLKTAFAELLQSRDRKQRAHVRDCLNGIFHDPRKVLSRYAGELVQRGQFRKQEGGRGWRVSAEAGHAARERHQEYIRWRLRHGKLRTRTRVLLVMERVDDDIV